MIVKLKHLLAIFFTTLFATTSASLGEEEEEEEEEARSSQPSSLPSVCPFCSTTNGITIPHSNNSYDDDNGGINDTFEYELCQRFVAGAQVISANSTHCEKLLAAEQLCCPNDKLNANGSGEDEEERMSLDYSFLYWYHAKVGKNEAKARKGRLSGKRRGGKKKVRDL